MELARCVNKPTIFCLRHNLICLIQSCNIGHLGTQWGFLLLKIGHMGGGLSYITLKGVKSSLQGVLHAWKRAKGRRVTQSPPVSTANFAKVFLESDLSSQPVLSSGDCIYSVASIWSPELGPIPVQSDSQRQARYQSQQSLAAQTQVLFFFFRIFLATSIAVSLLVGNASTHPEKVSTKTNRKRYPYLPGLTSVKSTSQCCPGLSPRYLIPVCCPFPGFIIWHALQAWAMSRTVACCRGNPKRAVCKKVSLFFSQMGGQMQVRTEVLTQVGGKYQVVILVSIPSVFALLRAGISFESN